MADKQISKKAPMFDWKTPIRFGIISGLVMVLVSVIGMVEAFDDRAIIAGVISMGQTVLVLALLLASYVAATKASGGRRIFSIAAGALTGLIGTVMLAALVYVAYTFNLREVFVNISPTLVTILTFNKSLPDQLWPALLLLVAYGIVIGGVAGLVQSLPDRPRKAILTGLTWVATLGLLAELIRTILTGKSLIGLMEWALGSRSDKGLSTLGALVIFALAIGGSFLSQRYGSGVRARVAARRAKLSPGRQRGLNYAIYLIAFLLLWQLPSVLGLFLSETANNVGLYILMGLGLNIVVGFAGLLDLGYVAFFAIGAYVMGVATSTAVGPANGQIVFSLGLTFWEALPLAIGAAVLAGVILGIPVLKMRGDYLAIVTLGFGEIIRILALSDMLKNNIGGAQGIVEIAPIMILGQSYSKPLQLFHIVMIACLLVAFVAFRLRDSRVGRAWKAVREDEDVAQAMGINLVATKLMAFASGAAFSGLAGAIFASKLTTIYPQSFSLLVSINILALVIIGGMGSLPGVVVGALALVGLPELLREFSEYRLLVFGAALVAMMILRPEGLLPEETHRRELAIRDEENAPAEPAATA